ncbi:hypothetical protein [Chlamydia vaughanii]|uniref:hypothetical protein n=1 Tax=Chlamydia vaughanii TaxID=3112552 RepID=UPI0032B19BA5
MDYYSTVTGGENYKLKVDGLILEIKNFYAILLVLRSPSSLRIIYAAKKLGLRK